MENAALFVVTVMAAWVSGSCFGALLTVLVYRTARPKERSRGATDGGPLEEERAETPGSSPPSVADLETERQLQDLDRKFRMLTGRLNRVDPPAKGTGEEKGDKGRQDGPGTTIDSPPGGSVTRGQVLAAWRARRGQ